MGPQKCDLKLSVLCQLAWFFVVVVVLTYYRMLLKRGTETGEPLGGTPYNGLYRAGTFSGFRFMEGEGFH